MWKTSLEMKYFEHSISSGAYLQMHHALDRFNRVDKFKDVICHSLRWARPTALQRQDFSRTYLAHHELESVMIIVIILTGSVTQSLT